jgi:hypothetical protein
MMIYGLIIVLSLARGNEINCEDAMYSYHWFILDSVDLVQSILICISAYFIIRHMKQLIRNDETSLMQINNISRLNKSADMGSAMESFSTPSSQSIENNNTKLRESMHDRQKLCLKK